MSRDKRWLLPSKTPGALRDAQHPVTPSLQSHALHATGTQHTGLLAQLPREAPPLGGMQAGGQLGEEGSRVGRPRLLLESLTQSEGYEYS